MTNLSHVVQDERTARMLLSMTVEPDDAVTGRLLGELGAFELLRLAERDDAVPGLSAVDAQVWRAQFERSDARTLGQRIVDAERAGIGTLIPGDGEWPSALDDLGDRRPYVLWTRGTTSFLARPLDDLVTITAARAATSYGEHVAAELASDLANAERIVWPAARTASKGLPIERRWHPTATRLQSWRTALIAPTQSVTVNFLSGWLTSASWSARFHQARFRRATASLHGRG